MPLIVFALAAYVAGLYAGFANSYLTAFAAAAIALAIATRRTPLLAPVFACLVGVGFAVSKARLSDNDRCAANAARAPALIVTIGDAASPGAFVTGTVADCPVPLSMSVVVGSAPGGSTVRASGSVIRTQRGLLMQRAFVTMLSPPPGIRRGRDRVGATIDRTFGRDAPLVRALVIADRSELSPAIRDRFAAAGMAHVLAIAGLHIGFIVLALTTSLELAKVSRARARAVTIVVIWIYVALIGAPIPAARSALMLTLLLGTALLQRPVSRWAIVALGGAQSIVDPSVVLAVGFQLSIVGVTAIIAAGILSERLETWRLGKLRRYAFETFLCTTMATIATASIVAWTFGRISLIAPVSNLFATPVLALVEPMLFAGLLLSPMMPLAHFVADAAHPLLAALDRIATVASSIPGAAPPVAPTYAVAALGCVVSLAVVVACASDEWRRPAMIAVVCTALIAWAPLAPQATGGVELHMIDVGQGDAIGLRTPHGHWVLFDAGGAWKGGDAGRATVAPYLGRRGGPVDVFILSHPHTDHVGGATSVFRALHVAEYIDAGFPGPAGAYRMSLDEAERERIPWQRAHPGDSLLVDGVTLSILAPDSTWTSHLVDPNLASVVVRVRYGDVRMLMMGDAERAEEEWILAHAPVADLRADILKVGHHGSKTSSSEAFLAAVKPRVALVSVGTGNSYHLPTPAIMQRLAAGGAQVLRTDRLGTIVARTDGRSIWIATSGDTWELSPTPSPH